MYSNRLGGIPRKAGHGRPFLQSQPGGVRDVDVIIGTAVYADQLDRGSPSNLLRGNDHGIEDLAGGETRGVV